MVEDLLLSSHTLEPEKVILACPSCNGALVSRHSAKELQILQVIQQGKALEQTYNCSNATCGKQFIAVHSPDGHLLHIRELNLTANALAASVDAVFTAEDDPIQKILKERDEQLAGMIILGAWIIVSASLTASTIYAAVSDLRFQMVESFQAMPELYVGVVATCAISISLLSGAKIIKSEPKLNRLNDQLELMRAERALLNIATVSSVHENQPE
jgi:hypothetical protein